VRLINAYAFRNGFQLVEMATGERCAASAIGSDYGKAKLEARLGAFERGPEIDRIEALGRAPQPQPERTPASQPERAPAAQERPQTTSRDGLYGEYRAERAHRCATPLRTAPTER
jgi:hypothetical protein